jgi:hypothetical protein
LLKEHVKQQKTSAGISSLLQDVFREAIQEMLKAEMDNTGRKMSASNVKYECCYQQ